MARTKQTLITAPLQVVSIKVTPEGEETLRRLSQEASDFLGWTVSTSAIVRALIRQVSQQGPPAADALFLEVEKEINSGRVWGSRKRTKA